MPTILDSLYHGSLFPNEKVIPKDPNYRPINRQITESLEAWKLRLSDGDFEELESLLELYSQVQGMEMATSFTYGFKVGAAMMIEILSDPE
ncbi:DUF6809 family protein [Paenibacillus donghaensis]|uniref:Uncharacterized protein n=1 Tax=Paenibacillus donghaensis TaxID=414771 RepID=A0A2Z2KQW3_9BACL|nr:DUF6809 family protein [Paenibacillus donghaensis]ASA25149.1 hypothetical protein B9T62_33095 [Paenibacillus donghaensis]